MKGEGRLRRVFFYTTGCLVPFFFYFQSAFADTIELKNGKILKGLVVENHTDRVIVSTEKGEIPILLSGIKEIKYSDPEQNFLQVGKAYEAQNKLGEALAYYEKALEANPQFEEAKSAAMGVRNRFWSQSTEGPRDEMEKQQMIYESWKSGKSIQTVAGDRAAEEATQLKEGLGLALEKKGDWVSVSQVLSKKDAAQAKVKKNDRLVSIDGQSLRYLGADVVIRKLLTPRYSGFTLEYERDLFLHQKTQRDKDPGLKLTLKYQGVAVAFVKAASSGETAGFTEGDLVVRVNGESTRYMPLSQVLRAIGESKTDPVVCAVRREVLLTRR